MGDIWHRNHLLSPRDINSINVIKKKVSRLENFLRSCRNLLKHANSETTKLKPWEFELVCCINSKATRQELLVQTELSLKKAVDIAVGMEITDKEINQFSNDKQVNKVEFQECFKSGKQNSSPDKCFHKNSECHICKKKGHISPKCPEKGKELLPRKTLQSLQFKISPNRRRRAKMLNLKKRREILRSSLLTLKRKLVLIVKFLQIRKRIPIVIGPCLPHHHRG